MHSVHEVFTPSSIANLTFVERQAINDRLVDSLRTRGKQIVIFGHSGCGKTTLLENKLKQTYSTHVRTPCMKGMKFEDILADPLRQMNSMTLSESQLKRGSKGTLGISSGTLIAASGSAGIESSTETSLKHAPIVPAAPTPQMVAEVIGRSGGCWVLEDFHKVEPSEREKLAQCMKMFMDMSDSFPDLKMIFIGAVHTGRQVIQYDSELRHRVAEIHVPLMTHEELNEILSLGEKYLNIRFDHRVKQSIVAMSNGLAAVAHQLALHFCLARGIEATQPKLDILDTGKWRTAIERYLEDSSDTLKAAFDRSVKNLKKRKYDHGRLILRAMTKLPQDGGTHAEILGEIRKTEGAYPSGSLTTHLSMLQSEARGAILSCDDTSGHYFFSEPVHRAFCYSLFEVEKRHMTIDSPALSLEATLAKLIPQLAELVVTQQLRRNGNDSGN